MQVMKKFGYWLWNVVLTNRVKCGGFCPTCPYWNHCREESEEERNG